MSPAEFAEVITHVQDPLVVPIRAAGHVDQIHLHAGHESKRDDGLASSRLLQGDTGGAFTAGVQEHLYQVMANP